MNRTCYPSQFLLHVKSIRMPNVSAAPWPKTRWVATIETCWTFLRWVGVLSEWKPWWRGCAAHDNLVSASPNPQTQEDIQENSWIVSRSSNKPSKLVRIPCRCRLPALRTSRHADKWNCIKETVFLCAVTFKIICTVFCFFCCRLCSVTRRRFKVSEACISVNSQEEVSLQCH